VKLHSRTDPPTLVRIYQHHQAPVLSIDFHPRLPHLMLTTSMDGTAVIVDTQADDDNAVVQRFKDHQRYVVRGVFSPGPGRFFATASYDRTLCIYKDNTSSEDDDDKASYDLVAKRGPYVGNVETLVFSPDGTTLIAGIQNDHCLHVIHLDDSDLTQRANDTKINLNANGDDWVSFSPTWLSFHPTGGLLMVSTDHASGRLILLDPFHGGKQIQNYHVAPASDTTFTTRRHAFHPSGRYFYVIGGDTHHTVKVVETKTGHLEATLDGGHDKMIKSMVYDPWVCGLWTAGFDHTLALWSTQAAMDDLLR
jgi:WD40 repeat protein